MEVLFGDTSRNYVAVDSVISALAAGKPIIDLELWVGRGQIWPEQDLRGIAELVWVGSKALGQALPMFERDPALFP